MNFVYICMTFFALVLSNNLHAQRVLMPDDIRRYWENQYDTVPISSYDRLDRQSDVPAGYFIKSKQLSNTGQVTLPPSVWSCYEKTGNNDYISTSDIIGEGKILCWMGLVNANPAAERKIRKQLARKYGVLTDRAGREGIPARWVNDCLYLVENPKYKMGLWVGEVYASRDVCFKDGVFCKFADFHGYDDDDNYNIWNLWRKAWGGTVETTVGYDGYSLSNMSEELFESFSLGSYKGDKILADTHANTIRKFRLQLLANNLALFSNRITLPAENRISNVPVFIYELPDGNVRMEVIGSENYTGPQIKELEVLASTFEKMPKYSCISQYYTTLEGLVFGELLYVSSSSFYWIFSDTP